MKFIIFFIAIIIVITIATPIQPNGGWSSNGGWNSENNNVALYNNGWNNGQNSKWWPSQNNIIVRKYIQESPGWNGYGGAVWNNNGGWTNGGWTNGRWKDNTGYGNGWQYNTGNHGLNNGWKNNYNSWC